MFFMTKDMAIRLDDVVVIAVSEDNVALWIRGVIDRILLEGKDAEKFIIAWEGYEGQHF